MLKTNRTSFKIGIIFFGIVLILMFGVKWTIQFFRIDACLDKGGKWNYDLNECDCLYNLDSVLITDYYWDSDFDTLSNHEYLIRGKMLDSISKSPNELIEILNRRPAKCKIEYIEFNGDTINIRILDDEYLTEQMGTVGADCFMAETVFTLSENDLIKFIRFEMDYGSHASPGLYSRKNYERMISE